MLLARADAGVETLHRGPLDLGDTLRDVCRQGRTLAEAKPISFQERILATAVMVDGDRDALYRLFLILIDNAVKYTPPHGQINVSLTSSNEFAVAEVQDTGIGIAANDLPHIFDRFYRGVEARSHGEGAGLGLSIARWIADAHRATIDVTSVPGTGTRVGIRFPVVSSE